MKYRYMAFLSSLMRNAVTQKIITSEAKRRLLYYTRGGGRERSEGSERGGERGETSVIEREMIVGCKGNYVISVYLYFSLLSCVAECCAR